MAMKKLIIVCEERLRKYGDFLAQLISRTDDTDNMIVGVKDGAAVAQVWTEKEYTSNAAQISSEQYILFIGNTNLIKEKRHHMLKKYTEHGMNYGWLGKQAVAFVDHILSFDEYDDFYHLLSNNYNEGNQLKAVQLLSTKVKDIKTVKTSNEKESATEVEQVAEDKKMIQAEHNEVKNGIIPLHFVGKTIKKVFSNGVKAFIRVSDNIYAATKSKDIEDQQYTCLVLMFYLKGLNSFLGLDGAE